MDLEPSREDLAGMEGRQGEAASLVIQKLGCGKEPGCLFSEQGEAIGASAVTEASGDCL